jgi:hypothetical protein
MHVIHSSQNKGRKTSSPSEVVMRLQLLRKQRNTNTWNKLAKFTLAWYWESVKLILPYTSVCLSISHLFLKNHCHSLDLFTLIVWVGGYFLLNIDSGLLLLSLSLICHHLYVNLWCVVPISRHLPSILCVFEYLVLVQYQNVLQCRYVMQPATGQLKFGVHGYTLRVPCLLISINSPKVRTTSYVWDGEGGS